MLLPQLAETLPLLLQTRLQLQDQDLPRTDTCTPLITTGFATVLPIEGHKQQRRSYGAISNSD